MDPFWTPQRVRRVLRWYHELVALARVAPDPHQPPPRKRLTREAPEYETARLLADLHLGLARLWSYRRDWAALLIVIYLTGVPDDSLWWRRRELERVALLAAAQERPFRTVLRELTLATVAVAALLAGEDPPTP